MFFGPVFFIVCPFMACSSFLFINESSFGFELSFVFMRRHVTIFCMCLQDEITEMKRKLKIMNHQIDQLKEEISGKEAALVKEHLENVRVEKEKEGLKVRYDLV